MLYLLIACAWIAFACLGLAIARLARRSDRDQALALADWLALSSIGDRGAAARDGLRSVRRNENDRATG